MNISFYILSESKAQDILGFICQLTQTALNKSSQPLLILIDKDDELLSTLDEALWSYDGASFIPHQRLLHATISEPKDASKPVQDNNEALAPVLLSSYMPADFKGIVLNTTIHPVNRFMAATNNAQPTRVLELIKPDPESTQEGRHKYKAYQQLGYELTHFKV
ncbi:MULTISPECIES: DNA polymerase III subunit chi [Psychrobacter]|jgi:DNA polymerase-3 subunit chi|uniref:DNA polymerase III subunit chi n=1 Tax=Psychrobacter faecalis TaxID=180588 RepID=A0ABT9HJP4_9GAMM|nr:MULTISPECIES: DNA polymerase III subunit chi [Psychrobacter]MCG3861190.1 DNA polymerase III subunit chi [Psychrobacter sp. Ps5]MDP4545535.1 DNA polymerase III subunit chi [Psychrobacter faecalis]OAP69243.1 DNA polymerase III subunit chi [Psychrobacter sp. SHUES1]PKG86774.1 DNA polymerase III subunit chi [Psychrobacter sp. Sarcosine-02u-2]WLW66414.1 DNA polymerase III subunit chi [Psychrobacter sp. van23A]